MIWVRHKGGTDQGDSGGGGQSWDSGCITELEWIAFADGLNVRYNRNK